MTRLKVIGVAIGALALLAFSAWAWDMMKWKWDSQLTLADSQREVEAAQAQVEKVKAELNQAASTITELRARPPGERVVVRDVPADCQTCFANHRISVKTDSGKGWWTYQDPDVLDGKPGELALTSKFWAETVGPYQKTVENCQKKLKEATGGRPRLLVLDYRTTLAAGIATDGYRGQVRFEPVRFGGPRFSVGPWAELGSSLGPDGLVRAWGAAGLEIQSSK